MADLHRYLGPVLILLDLLAIEGDGLSLFEVDIHVSGVLLLICFENLQRICRVVRNLDVLHLVVELAELCFVLDIDVIIL